MKQDISVFFFHCRDNSLNYNCPSKQRGGKKSFSATLKKESLGLCGRYGNGREESTKLLGKERTSSKVGIIYNEST